MSEDTVAPDTTAPDTASPDIATPQDVAPVDKPTDTDAEVKMFDEDYVKGLRNEAAKYRTDLRSVQATLEPMQSQLDEARAEMATAVEARDELQRAADEAQARCLRYEVCAEAGIDLRDADRLRGSTQEELLADAKAFRERYGSRNLGQTGTTPAVAATSDPFSDHFKRNRS